MRALSAAPITTNVVYLFHGGQLELAQPESWFFGVNGVVTKLECYEQFWRTSGLDTVSKYQKPSKRMSQGLG